MHVEDGLVRDQPSIPDVDVWGIASVLKSLPIDHIRIRKFLLKPEFHLHCCFGLLDISGLAVSLIATVDQSICIMMNIRLRTFAEDEVSREFVHLP